MRLLRWLTAVIVFIMVDVSAICSAMIFQQPIEIGEFLPDISGLHGSGIVFRKVTDNVGEVRESTIRKGNKSYWKGMATFGTGNNAIYYHYNLYKR